MTDITHFDDYAIRQRAAYAAFEEVYRVKTPPPAPPQVARRDYVTLLALGALVIASIIVSGSRTVAEFGGGIVGASAFVMLELGIVAYGYIRTKKHYDASRAESVKRLTSAGMGIALTVAVAANVHATLKANGVLLPAAIDTLILLSVALSAPILAFISGDALGMEAVSNQRAQADAQAAYDAAMADWRDGLNRAFAGSALYKQARVSVEPDMSGSRLLSENTRQTRQTRQTGAGRPSVAQNRVFEHLSVYPDDADLPSRKLAIRIEEMTGAAIGHDSVNRARKQWLEANQ